MRRVHKYSRVYDESYESSWLFLAVVISWLFLVMAISWLFLIMAIFKFPEGDGPFHLLSGIYGKKISSRPHQVKLDKKTDSVTHYNLQLALSSGIFLRA